MTPDTIEHYYYDGNADLLKANKAEIVEELEDFIKMLQAEKEKISIEHKKDLHGFKIEKYTHIINYVKSL